MKFVFICIIAVNPKLIPPPYAAGAILADICNCESCFLCPRRSAPTSPSARPRYRAPEMSRRPSPCPRRMGYWPSGVCGSQ